MRFVMLMYPGPAAEAEGQPVPEGPEGQKLLEDMMAFNQRMVEVFAQAVRQAAGAKGGSRA